MSTPKLSICIATLNRASFIGETLDSLLPQHSDEVEVVVLDGGSSDGTDQVVGRYVSIHPCLRYIRMQEASGVDRDFDLAVEHARGEYCWLMTDDDVVKPGAVSQVLTALRHQYALVIVNAEVRNEDLTSVLEPRRLEFDRARVYEAEEMDRLFAETGGYLTYIGGVIIRRSIWSERNRHDYYGSLFIHVGVIFQGRLPGKALAIAETLISIRYGTALWRPRDFEIWMFKWPSLVWSLPGISPEARRAVCAAEPWRELPRLLFYRAKGSYSIEEYRRWIRPKCRSGLVRSGAFLIAIFPGLIANLIALLYFSLLKQGQGRALLETRSSRFHFRNWIRKPGLRRT